jgi:hypothetical protein
MLSAIIVQKFRVSKILNATMAKDTPAIASKRSIGLQDTNTFFEK